MLKTQETVSFALAVVALSLIAGSARANLVLDQVSDAYTASLGGELGGPTVGYTQSALQTFTVGVGGALATVDLQVQHSFVAPTGDLVLSILGTTGGVPDFNQNLGSVTLPASTIPPNDNFASGPFTSFDVSGLDIAVAPGDVLAFEVSYPTTTGEYFIYDSETDIYPGGSIYISGPLDGFFAEFPLRDLGFRTTVAVPEPAFPTALVLGGLVAAPRRRRRS